MRHYPRRHALPKTHCSILSLTAAKEEKGSPRRLSFPALIALSRSQSWRDFNPETVIPLIVGYVSSWILISIDVDQFHLNTWFPRSDYNKCRLSDCRVIYFWKLVYFKLKGPVLVVLFPVSRLPTCPTLPQELVSYSHDL